jgi:hypothetical protein
VLLQRSFFLLLAVATCSGSTFAQDAPFPQLTPGSARKPATSSITELPPPQVVSLDLPKGTPLQVALADEFRVRKVGEPIHGRIVEPVYAFDRIVIPVGSEVSGQITSIEGLSRSKRTMAVLDADLTPVRKIEVEFNELVLPDGKHFRMETGVTPGTGQVIKLVTSADEKSKSHAKDMASEKVKQAKQQAKDRWDHALQEVKTPGKVHRVERYVQSQLPIHPQYVPAGTVYFAELEAPLNFGSEVLTPHMAETMGAALPPGAVAHARLVTPLNSATSHQGDVVEAVLSQPLLDAGQLILPQGTRLKGVVLQAQPARHMKKNGQLRITFRELIPPDGVQQKVEATLAAVQAGKDANIKLDSESGAEATTSRTRYAATALSLALAAASAHVDHDGDASPGSRAAGGANGFKLVGMTLGLLVRSQPLGYAMGAYGAGVSVYSNFLARGHEVVFPKNTAMEIALATRAENPPKAKAGNAGGEGQ